MQDTQDLRTITINDTELNYVEQGKGRPVIFVHGSLGDYRTWDNQIGPFSENFSVISYSRRYHFPNKWTGDGSDYSVALHADDLSSMIQKLKIAPVHLVGNSYGAYVSLFMASRNPELVNSLVLGEPPILLWLGEIEGGEKLLKEFNDKAFEPAKQAFLAGQMEDGVHFFIDGVLGSGIFSRLPQTVKAHMMDNAREMKAETSAKEYFSILAFNELEKIKCPVLLLTGELSPKLFHLITDKLQECLPKNERVDIPNTSHSMQSGNPEFYNNKVMEFLRKIK